MAEKPFAAYEGTEPYFFVSYAHDDAESAYSEMSWIRGAGFNLWYDDGIHVGSVWRRALADALSRSSGLIFFAATRSVASDACLKEISFALDEGKPVFVVQLDDSSLPPELRLSLSDRQALVRSAFDEATYRSRLVDALKSVVEPAPASARASSEGKSHKPRTELPTIAVLPFASLSDDRELAFWAEGITGDLATALSQRYFKVVGGQDQTTARGGGSGARYVVSGNVLKGGDRLRINAKLMERDDGSQQWGARYERSANDLFEIQDELVTAIAVAISETVVELESARSRARDPQGLDAWALVMRVNELAMDSPRSRDEILGWLRRAVELDPEFALARCDLAVWLTISIVTLFSPNPDEDAAEALAHTDRALALAPREPAVLSGCSYVHRVLGSVTFALEIAERAVAISGSGAALYGPRGRPNGLYTALITNGRAEEVIERAVRDSPPPARDLCTACVVAGRYEEALQWAQKGVGEAPDQFLPWVELANVLGLLERLEEGRGTLAKAKSMVPQFTVALYERGARISWRDKNEIVEPTVAGLRMLEENQ